MSKVGPLSLKPVQIIWAVIYEVQIMLHMTEIKFQEAPYEHFTTDIE